MVEQPSFKAFLHDLQPNTSLMSRPTFRRKMDEAALEMKTNMKKAMSEIDFIATTTDCWCSRRRGFIGVTAWVDPNSLKRCSVALACRQLKVPHTFDVLACALNDIHSEFGIQNKVVRTTTYNGTNFLKPFRIYREHDENKFASEETEDEISDVMCDGDEEDVDGVKVDFVEVTVVLDEDDGLQFQLPKHHRCACH